MLLNILINEYNINFGYLFYYLLINYNAIFRRFYYYIYMTKKY